ncbi:hypothetical protein GGS21DRAFT_45698 [Xylaria nigripes]|nr:hypothetical protein GGS21DRAFT_45698 [Xylaria nigripes]
MCYVMCERSDHPMIIDDDGPVVSCAAHVTFGIYCLLAYLLTDIHTYTYIPTDRLTSSVDLQSPSMMMIIGSVCLYNQICIIRTELLIPTQGSGLRPCVYIYLYIPIYIYMP